MTDFDTEKRLAAQAGAQLVQPGTTVGLGTGSTVAYLLSAPAHRGLQIRCVANSVGTFNIGQNLGVNTVEFNGIDRL